MDNIIYNTEIISKELAQRKTISLPSRVIGRTKPLLA